MEISVLNFHDIVRFNLIFTMFIGEQVHLINVVHRLIISDLIAVIMFIYFISGIAAQHNIQPTFDGYLKPRK